MKFLFSGAKNPMSYQNDKTQSLGGYMSSTPIPNGRAGAIFSSISSYAKKNKKEEVFGFFLLNETANPLNNLSIQQIYKDTLGVDESEADFEWAVVIPTDDNRMELIGSPNEIPFEAQFFSPTTRRESCTLKITKPALSGQNFNLLGEVITFVGSTIEDMVDEIVEHFKIVDTYRVEKYSNQHVYIISNELLGSGAVVQISGLSNAESNTVNFSGFLEGETIISDSLLPNKSLGVWVKRIIKDVVIQDFNETEMEIESLEILFNYD